MNKNIHLILAERIDLKSMLDDKLSFSNMHYSNIIKAHIGTFYSVMVHKKKTRKPQILIKVSESVIYILSVLFLISGDKGTLLVTKEPSLQIIP